jgi:hypothetical protein
MINLLNNELTILVGQLAGAMTDDRFSMTDPVSSHVCHAMLGKVMPIKSLHI